MARFVFCCEIVLDDTVQLPERRQQEHLRGSKILSVNSPYAYADAISHNIWALAPR